MKNRKPETEIERKMVEVLCAKMSDDEDFLIGVMAFLENDDERQAMIDEINNGSVKTPSDALLFAVQIDKDRQVDDFYSTAVELCEYIREEEISEKSIDYLLSALMNLYASALELPHIEPETEDIQNSPERNPLNVKFHKDFPTSYNLFFNPIKDEAPVCGDLLCDLRDIVTDLQRGIDEYEAGNTGNAVFEWSFGLSAHWGQHAVDAMKVLHTIRNN